MHHFKTPLFSLIIFCVGVCLLAGPAHAGLRIDSPKVRLSMVAGGHQSGEVEVENTGKEPIAVRVYLEDWVFSDQTGGKTFFPKGTQKMSCAPWINFYPADLELAQGSTHAVRYTVSVPQGAAGGHFCVMFFETGGGTMERVDDTGNLMTVKVLNRVGALFYIEPEGTIERRGEILKMEAGPRLNDFIVSADFVNTGNTDIITQGTFNVFDAEGYVYARGEFEESYTLPGDEATLHAAASSVNLRAGSYDLIVTLEYEQGGVLTKEASFTLGPDGTVSPLTLKD